jgi:rod shape-determining protein MreC
MRNLIAFFKRFRIFLYFALLQGIALSTYFTYLSYPRSQYLTTASAVAASISRLNAIMPPNAEVGSVLNAF